MKRKHTQVTDDKEAEAELRRRKASQYREEKIALYLDSLSVRMSTSSDRITCGSRLSSSRMAFSISLSDFVCSNASLEFSRNRSSNSFLSVPIIRVSNC